MRTLPGLRHLLQGCSSLTAQGSVQLFLLSVVEIAARNTDLQAGTATCAQWCTSLELPYTQAAWYGRAETTVVTNYEDRLVQSLP